MSKSPSYILQQIADLKQMLKIVDNPEYIKGRIKELKEELVEATNKKKSK